MLETMRDTKASVTDDFEDIVVVPWDIADRTTVLLHLYGKTFRLPLKDYLRSVGQVVDLLGEQAFPSRGIATGIM